MHLHPKSTFACFHLYAEETYFFKVTAKFKCAVRVVDIFPWLPDDFISPDGTYRIRLTLEDPTARIHAFLFADDAVYRGCSSLYRGSPSDLVYFCSKILNIFVSLNAYR